MASEVDICNLALGHLGDNATVASIDPPEGSAQAEHCQRFYPIARDTLLELHNWNFATRRAQLAQVICPWPEWKYAYAQPANTINVLAVMPPQANNDYSENAYSGTGFGTTTWDRRPPAAGMYVPQPFSCETDAAGNDVIYTNQENAVLRYTVRVEDPTQFSPLFVQCLSWHLASMLAGPVVKGDAGAAEAKRCAAMMSAWLGKAMESDANQRKSNAEHIVNWMAGR